MNPDEIPCPYCGETIKAVARKCKHCGEWLYPSASLPTTSSFQSGEASSPDPAPASGSTGVDTEDILNLLDSLVSRNLVVYEPHSDGPGRYRLLETVRQYAGGRFSQEDDDARAYRRRHFDYFLALAEEAYPGLQGAEQKTWLNVLETEHDNLRQALDWNAEEPQGGQGSLKLVTVLWKYWQWRGLLTEGRERLKTALAHPDAIAWTIERVRAIGAAGNLAYRQGDVVEGRALLEEAHDRARERDDRETVAFVSNSLGLLENEQHNFGQAQQYLEESLEVWRERDDKPGMAAVLNNLGLLARSLADPVTAKARFEEAQELNRAMGNRASEANNLMNLGILASDVNDYETARHCYTLSLEIRRELGDRTGLANTLINLGVIALDGGDLEGAQPYFEEALALYREQEHRAGIAAALANLGTLARMRGDHDRAGKWLREALGYYRVAGDRTALRYLLVQLARLGMACGAPAWATRLYAAQDADAGGPEDPDLPTPEREPNPGQPDDLVELRNALGSETFRALWISGHALPLEQAITLALERHED